MLFRSSLKAGGSLKGTIDLVREFRREDDATPIVLMGYFNPIYTYGIAAFVKDAAAAGVDGLIVVDLPPEEESELTQPAKVAGIDLIHLTAPTTTDERLPTVVGKAGGFVYYVSVTGITGTKSAAATDVEAAIARIRRYTKLPIEIGRAHV